MNTSTQNSRGEWVTAIPLPLFLAGHRYRCMHSADCRRVFWTMDGYRGHYALAHVLALS